MENNRNFKFPYITCKPGSFPDFKMTLLIIYLEMMATTGLESSSKSLIQDISGAN